MADSVDFLIELQEKMSGPATRASQALAKLEAEIGKERTALAGLESKLADTAKKMELLNQGGSVNINAMRKLQQQHSDLSKAIEQGQGSLGKLTAELPKLQSAAQNSSLPMEFLSDKLAAMGGPAGIAVGAFTAVGAAVVAVTAELSEFALAQSNAHRSFEINIEAITGSTIATEKLLKTIESAKTDTPLASARLEDLAKSLTIAGLNADQTERTLRSLAQVESTVGQGASEALLSAIQKSATAGQFEVTAKQLKETGVTLPELYQNIAKKMGVGAGDVEKLMKEGKVSVDVGLQALNDAINSKFGDLSGEKLLDFDTQITKLKDKLADLFKDVDIKGFLKGLQDLLSIFNADSESGQQLKEIVNGIFGGIGDAIAAAMPSAKAFIEGLVDGMHSVYIEAKFLGEALDAITPPGQDNANAWRLIGQAIAFVISEVLIVAAAFGEMVAVFETINDLIVRVAGVIVDITVAFAEAGKNAIQGFIDGLLGSSDAAVDATSSVGSKIAQAFAVSHEQSSPSKLFGRMAMYDVMGYTQGFERYGGAANDSIARVGLGVGARAATGVAAGGGGSKGGDTHTHNWAIHINNPKDGADAGAQATAGVKRALAEAGLAA